jgi:translation initiation factor 2B subunit (eIF-2B alpha/beta/delta family)
MDFVAIGHELIATLEDPREMIEKIKQLTKNITNNNPLEFSISNCARRLLTIIREHIDNPQEEKRKILWAWENTKINDDVFVRGLNDLKSRIRDSHQVPCFKKVWGFGLKKRPSLPDWLCFGPFYR